MLMEASAILLLHCPDQPGIISEVTKFITDNQGNIVYLDQYVDREDGMFFMRIEWELERFLVPKNKIKEYLNTEYNTLPPFNKSASNLSVEIIVPLCG